MLRLLAMAAVAFVALLHFLFFVMESFLWTKPFGRRTFGLTPELAEATKTLAFNQGFYNAFLAVGLVWGLAERAAVLQIFFLGCVIVAGIVGGFSAKRSILIVQALPAVIALLLVLATR